MKWGKKTEKKWGREGQWGAHLVADDHEELEEPKKIQKGTKFQLTGLNKLELEVRGGRKKEKTAEHGIEILRDSPEKECSPGVAWTRDRESS